MNLLLSWLILTTSIGVTAALLPGFEVKGTWGAIKVGAVFGVLHWLLGTLLFVVIGIGTLGIGFLLAFITRWIVTALVLKLTDAVSTSIEIKSFKHALVGALVLSAVSTGAEWLVSRVL